MQLKIMYIWFYYFFNKNHLIDYIEMTSFVEKKNQFKFNWILIRFSLSLPFTETFNIIILKMQKNWVLHMFFLKEEEKSSCIALNSNFHKLHSKVLNIWTKIYPLIDDRHVHCVSAIKSIKFSVYRFVCGNENFLIILPVDLIQKFSVLEFNWVSIINGPILR